MKSNAVLEVYNLIHSLNATEKSYFRKSLSKRSDGKMGNIFEIFNKRTKFEEEAIREQLKRSYSNPTDACSKLSQAILKSMVNYHSSSNAHHELNLLLSQVDFTYGKEQLATCERLINKGLTIAKKNNLYAYVYLFWYWKTRLPVFGYEAHKARYENALEEMKQMSALQLRGAQMIALQRSIERFAKWKRHSRQGNRDLLSILNSEIANPASYAQPIAGVMALQANTLIAGINFEYGNWETAYEYTSEHIESFGPAENLPDRQFRNWLAGTNNVMGLCVLLYKKEEYLRRREQLVSVLESRKLDTQPRAFANLVHNDTSHKVMNGDYKEAISELKVQIQQAQKGSVGVLYDKETLMHSLSVARFMEGNYKGVIVDCNEILADKACLKNLIIIHTTKWIEILSVYLLDYSSLFSNRILSMKRYLKKLGSGFDWELDIIKTLQNTFEKSEEEKRKAFKALFQRLQEFRFELRVAIRDFDMLMWVEAMSLGRSIGELTVERYNK